MWAATHSEDVFKQFEDSWGTDEQATSTTVLPESSTPNIYRPEEDNVPNTSYDEFETPFKCVVLYNYTVIN